MTFPQAVPWADDPELAARVLAALQEMDEADGFPACRDPLLHTMDRPIDPYTLSRIDGGAAGPPLSLREDRP